MSCKSVPIFYLILYSLQYLPILLSSDTPNQLLNWRGWDKLRVHAFILSHSSSVCILMIPWTVAFQVPLSMGFSRQEYWSGLPCPPPGDLPNPGIEPTSLIPLALAGKFFTIEPQGKSTIYTYHCGSAGKESVCNEGDLGSIPWLGRSHG